MLVEMNQLTVQSAKNLVTIVIAFLIGAINTLILYPYFFGAEKQGLVVFLLSTSNLLMPLIGLGISQTIIKFYSSYPENQKQNFLSFVVIIPLIIIIPLSLLSIIFHDFIASLISLKNPIIYDYLWVVVLIAISTSYFEIFYSWARVNFKTVSGNVLKEIYPRMIILILLVLFGFKILNLDEFFEALVTLYYLRLFLMIVIALKIKKPSFSLSIPQNINNIIKYSLFLILAASASTIIIDIDKSMLSQFLDIKQTAFYAVAVFTATLIEVPGRAMFQILNPMISKAINQENFDKVKDLYKESSLNLLIISGWFFLNVNLSAEYLLILFEDKGYSTAISVILMISIAKLFSMSSGASNVILINSKYYHISLILTIIMSIVVVIGNLIFIPIIGINGAALTTLLTVVIFTIIRVIYVKKLFDVQPYNIKNITTCIIIIVVYILFNNNFLGFNPIVKIIFNALMVTLTYLLLIRVLKISPFLNKIISLK